MLIAQQLYVQQEHNNAMEDESLERALADHEIVSAAYPDEVTTEAGISFPLRFTINLTEDAFVTLELIAGYPTETGVQVSTYRSKPHEKARIEAVVSAIREISEECQQDGIEGGFACCSKSLDVWAEAQEEAEEELSQIAKAIAAAEDSTPPTRTYEWITGEPLMDKKSTFLGHICRVTSEQEVREAMHQLLTGSSKLQRASHNMSAWRVSEVTPDGRTVRKHDNDDDGEDAAGSKLAYLLDMRQDDNVVVVVSRWFGGIQLGPKRFAHIINVARVLLVEHCTSE